MPTLAQGAALWGDPDHFLLLVILQSRVGQLGGMMALYCCLPSWVVSGCWAGCSRW